MKLKIKISTLIASALTMVLLQSGNVAANEYKNTNITSNQNIENQSRVYQKKVTTTNLNLRTGPSTNNSIILTIPKDTVVEIIGTNGNWSNVKYSNKTGYVNNQYLKSYINNTVSTTKIYEVIADTLNIRSSATTSSTVLGKVTKGTRLNVISITNGWAKINYNGSYAYASSQYLKLVQSNTQENIKTYPVSESIYLRSKKDWSSEKIALINKGEKVEFLGKDGTWANVKFNQKIGYIDNKYISDSSNESDNISFKEYEVVADTLNIRSKATTDSDIISKVTKGTKLKVVSITNGWAKINYNGSYAYASSQYLKLVQSNTQENIKTYPVSESIYLRSQKDWSSEKIALINKGEKVEFLGKDGTWANVKFNQKSGYVDIKYLVGFEDSEIKPMPSTIKYTTTNVNFRTGPSTSKDIIETLNKGTEVESLETIDGWDKIKYNNKVGYINSSYLSLDKNELSGNLPPASSEYNKFLIAIDAGHGAQDSGAVGLIKKIKEKDVTLDVSIKVNNKLKSLGFKTIMTRTSDTYPSLSSRYNLANNSNANLFLSVHFNSATSTSAKGIETLYRNSNEYANEIQKALIYETKAIDRGIKNRTDLAVLNGTKMQAALVELGFLSNEYEESLASQDQYREKLANGIVKGIVNYTNNKLINK